MYISPFEAERRILSIRLSASKERATSSFPALSGIQELAWCRKSVPDHNSRRRRRLERELILIRYSYRTASLTLPRLPILGNDVGLRPDLD